MWKSKDQREQPWGKSQPQPGVPLKGHGCKWHKRLPGEDMTGFKASNSKDPAKSVFYHVVSVPLTSRCTFSPAVIQASHKPRSKSIAHPRPRCCQQPPSRFKMRPGKSKRPALLPSVRSGSRTTPSRVSEALSHRAKAQLGFPGSPTYNIRKLWNEVYRRQVLVRSREVFLSRGPPSNPSSSSLLQGTRSSSSK